MDLIFTGAEQCVQLCFIERMVNFAAKGFKYSPLQGRSKVLDNKGIDFSLDNPSRRIISV
jgi:hypothetical protein